MSLKNKKVVLLPLLAVAALVVTSAAPAGAAASKGLVGFSYPIQANTYLAPIGGAAEKTLKKSGYTMLGIDAQLDGNKQISDVETMITKKVKAMIIYPLDSKGLKPSLDKAAAAGIKVITMNYSTDDSTKAPPSPALAQVQDAFTSQALADDRVAYLKKVLPAGGNVLYVGLAFPVAALEKHADLFKATLAAKGPKFTYLGRVDNPSDNSEGGRTATDAALIKYPKVDAIVAYNDPTALGAYAAVKAAGKAGKIKIIGLQMQPEAVTSIKNNEINGSWDYNPVQSGVNLANLTISILKDRPKASWNKTIQTKADFYDNTTIAQFKPWADRLAAIK
jgi:ribose transport system substrate-binding protein